MPFDDPSDSDPMTLHGVLFDVDDPDAHRDMAECFVEEFIRLGFDRARLLRMFHARGYAGPHLALKILGESAIEQLIDSCLARWGPHAPLAPNVVTRAAVGVSLRVLPTDDPAELNLYHHLHDPHSADRACDPFTED